MQSTQDAVVLDEHTQKLRTISNAWDLLKDLVTANLISEEALTSLKEKASTKKNQSDTVNLLRQQLFTISFKENKYDPNTPIPRPTLFDRIDIILRFFNTYWYANEQKDGIPICPLRETPLTEGTNQFIGADIYLFNEQDIATWYNTNNNINPWTKRAYNPRDTYRLNELRGKYYPETTAPPPPVVPNENRHENFKLFCAMVGFAVGAVFTFYLIIHLIPLVTSTPLSQSLIEPIMVILCYGSLFGGLLSGWLSYKASSLAIDYCCNRNTVAPATQRTTPALLLDRIRNAAPVRRRRSYEGIEMDQVLAEAEPEALQEPFPPRPVVHHVELAQVLAESADEPEIHRLRR